jgi:hypothetical protein
VRENLAPTLQTSDLGAELLDLLVRERLGCAAFWKALDVYSNLFADGIEEAAARFDPPAGGRREVGGRVASGG